MAQDVAAPCDPSTPDEVLITKEARRPAMDPTLGVHVQTQKEGTPSNPLVTIGDSLTHGFQSAAIFNTDLSYPAIIAYEMGVLGDFRRPHYWGFGGLPLNLEFLIRELEGHFGEKIDWYELPMALFRARHWMAQMEHWWEHGPGSQIPPSNAINHNLAVFGWDLRDTLWRTWARCYEEMQPSKSQLVPNVENGNNLAALRVLPSFDAAHRALTPLTAAAELASMGTKEDGSGDGIETLIVFIGANNALSAVTHFRVCWSGDDYADPKKKAAYNVWRPSHFQKEFDLVVAEVERVRARHVIWATVPHVTVIPLAHGVGTEKHAPKSPYFANYTWPWIDEPDFHPESDPHLTHEQVHGIDCAIDQYNAHIENRIREFRQAGHDWYLFDVAGLLDRLASRRYIEDPEAQPSWWKDVGGAYPLPPDLAALSPKFNSYFFRSDAGGRKKGGLFALDGVHPTTVGYGIVAQEFMNVMDLAGVRFPQVDKGNPRVGAPKVNFQRLLRRDTLMRYPPTSLSSDLKTIGWLDEVIEVFQHLFKRGPSAPKG